MKHNDVLLTIGQVAHLTYPEISYEEIRAAMKFGILPFEPVGRCRFVWQSNVEQFCREQRVNISRK